MADAIPAAVAPEEPKTDAPAADVKKEDPKKAAKAAPKADSKEDPRGVKLGNHEAFRKDN